MSVQYYGYSRMPTNLYETFTSEDLIQAKQQFKQFTIIPIYTDGYDNNYSNDCAKNETLYIIMKNIDIFERLFDK